MFLHLRTTLLKTGPQIVRMSPSMTLGTSSWRTCSVSQQHPEPASAPDQQTFASLMRFYLL